MLPHEDHIAVGLPRVRLLTASSRQRWGEHPQHPPQGVSPRAGRGNTCRSFSMAIHYVFAKIKLLTFSNLSSRGVSFTTWGSAGKHPCKKVTATPPTIFSNVPPTCLQYIVGLHAPQPRPPTPHGQGRRSVVKTNTIKGLYY